MRTKKAPASMAMSSRTFTSCSFPSEMRIKVGILPCRSSRVCIFTAALCFRNFAHGKSARHRSMVVESKAYRLIQALVEVHAERLVGVERPRDFNQDMGKLGEDAPVACFVGVGQSAARHRAAKPQVIEFPGHGSEAGFDVPQALAVSQLREGHRQVLIPVRKLPRLRMIVVTGHAFLKLLVREMGDQL